MSTTNSTCMCGGCATGTTCKFTTSYISTGSQEGVYAYATPEIMGQPTSPGIPADADPDTIHIKVDGSDITETIMRKTLQDELVADLLQRVQKLETAMEEQQVELEELRKAKETTEDPFKGLSKFLDELLKNAR